MAETVLKRIYLSSLKFLVPLDLEETCAKIVNEAVKLVNAKWGSVLLEQDGELKRVYSSIPAQYQVRQRRRGFLYKAFKAGKTVILSSKEIEKVHPELKPLSIVSDVVIPLSYRDQSIGILAILTQKEKQFGRKDINTLILFGSMASLAVQRARAYDETKKALEARDLFISMASHELKTPVTTIHGYSQLLFNTRTRKKRIKEEWIGSLHAECFRLKFLINDLLEINRIHIGKLQYYLEECSLRNIIDRTIENFRINYPDRKVVLKDNLNGKPALLVGDFNKLMQVFINVLDNAVKFSSPGTIISINLESDDGNFIVRVKDEGRGIARKDLPKIFERFYKGEGTSHEGLGLGLFLVKSIVDYHHGSVRLFSRLNKGTTIEVSLPKIMV